MAIEQNDSPAKESASRSEHPQTSYPTLSIDWDIYGEYLDGLDLTDEEKQEAIVVFWNIAVAWVDLGLGLHPVQQVDGNRCEQNGDNAQLDLSAVIECLPDTSSAVETIKNGTSVPHKKGVRDD